MFIISPYYYFHVCCVISYSFASVRPPKCQLRLQCNPRLCLNPATLLRRRCRPPPVRRRIRRPRINDVRRSASIPRRRRRRSNSDTPVDFASKDLRRRRAPSPQVCPSVRDKRHFASS